MKTGMTSNTFKEKTIEEVIKIAKKAEIDGIEWGVTGKHITDDSSIEEIKKLSEEYGIEIFSMGSYCCMEDYEHCIKTVSMAKLLGAPIIRVWAGEKSPEECDNEYFELIAENTRKMAGEAKKYGMTISFEYHNHSLTETPESTIKLIKAVGRENVKVHWQPTRSLGTEKNKAELYAVSPYLSGIFHIHNYSPETKYSLIEEIKDSIKIYFEEYKDTDSCVLVEFTKNAEEENFYKDVKTLKEVLK